MIDKETMYWIEGLVADDRFMNRTPAEQHAFDILLAEVKLHDWSESSAASVNVGGGKVL